MRARRLIDLAIVAVVGGAMLAIAGWLVLVGWEVVRWTVGDSFSPMPLPSLVGVWIVCMPLVFAIAAWDDSKARRAEPFGEHDRARRLAEWFELNRSGSLDDANWFTVARGIPAVGAVAFFILFLPTVIVLHGLELDFSRWSRPESVAGYRGCRIDPRFSSISAGALRAHAGRRPRLACHDLPLVRPHEEHQGLAGAVSGCRRPALRHELRTGLRRERRRPRQRLCERP